MRYIPTFRRPVLGSCVKTIGNVMNGPPSCGQQVNTGKCDKSTSSPKYFSSLHGPSLTVTTARLCNVGNIFIPSCILPSNLGGGTVWISSAIRAAISCGLPRKASSMRSCEPYKPIATGTSGVSCTFSNSKAGPAFLIPRSATSAISKLAERGTEFFWS